MNSYNFSVLNCSVELQPVAPLPPNQNPLLVVVAQEHSRSLRSLPSKRYETALLSSLFAISGYSDFPPFLPFAVLILNNSKSVQPCIVHMFSLSILVSHIPPLLFFFSLGLISTFQLSSSTKGWRSILPFFSSLCFLLFLLQMRTNCNMYGQLVRWITD